MLQVKCYLEVLLLAIFSFMNVPIPSNPMRMNWLIRDFWTISLRCHRLSVEHTMETGQERKE
jgi:hypothetical protein